MVQQELVKQKLYDKYIEPTKKKKEKYIGIEIEMPILNLDKKSVDFEVIHQITKNFIGQFGFQAEGIDDGNIYAAMDKVTGDILSYDCSYNNLELSLGRGKDINTLYERFKKYYKYLEKELLEYNYTLTGMGVNPYRKYNRNMPIPNGRYRINPHNIGMVECKFESIDDLMAYIQSTSIYCVERDEKYINFPPINIMEYFKQDFVTGEYFEGKEYKKIDVVPRIEDINYLRTFKFEDLTFRGTIEFRSVCCQPIKDSILVAAFHVGLKEKTYELSKLFDNDHVIYHHGYTATELRRLFVRNKIPDFIDQDKLYELAKKIVDLSKEGLVNRGFGEEKYLAPLYERIESRTNPAKRMLKLLAGGQKLEDIVLAYGKIE